MDNAHIHKVEYSADDLSYQITNTNHFVWESHKSLLHDFAKLDWAHAHITDRSITFGGVIYKVTSKLQREMNPPRAYFGERKRELKNNS